MNTHKYLICWKLLSVRFLIYLCSLLQIFILHKCTVLCHTLQGKPREFSLCSSLISDSLFWNSSCLSLPQHLHPKTPPFSAWVFSSSITFLAERWGNPGAYFICFPSLGNVCGALAVVQCLKGAVSSILCSFLVVNGRRASLLPLTSQRQKPGTTNLVGTHCDIYSIQTSYTWISYRVLKRKNMCLEIGSQEELFVPDSGTPDRDCTFYSQICLSDPHAHVLLG